LVGRDGDCDRRWCVVDSRAEAKLAAPNLWNSVPGAATPDWRTRGHRTRQCSAELVRRFTIASVATSGIFWLLVGTLGGLIYSRCQADP